MVVKMGGGVPSWSQSSKDTNRKIRKTELIYICGSLIVSKLGSSSANTGERMYVRDATKFLAWYLEPKFNHIIL